MMSATLWAGTTVDCRHSRLACATTCWLVDAKVMTRGSDRKLEGLLGAASLRERASPVVVVTFRRLRVADVLLRVGAVDASCEAVEPVIHRLGAVRDGARGSCR